MTTKALKSIQAIVWYKHQQISFLQQIMHHDYIYYFQFQPNKLIADYLKYFKSSFQSKN